MSALPALRCGAPALIPKAPLAGGLGLRQDSSRLAGPASPPGSLLILDACRKASTSQGIPKGSGRGGGCCGFHSHRRLSLGRPRATQNSEAGQGFLF